MNSSSQNNLNFSGRNTNLPDSPDTAIFACSTKHENAESETYEQDTSGEDILEQKDFTTHDFLDDIFNIISSYVSSPLQIATSLIQSTTSTIVASSQQIEELKYGVIEKNTKDEATIEQCSAAHSSSTSSNFKDVQADKNALTPMKSWIIYLPILKTEGEYIPLDRIAVETEISHLSNDLDRLYYGDFMSLVACRNEAKDDDRFRLLAALRCYGAMKGTDLNTRYLSLCSSVMIYERIIWADTLTADQKNNFLNLRNELKELLIPFPKTKRPLSCCTGSVSLSLDDYEERDTEAKRYFKV